MANERSSRKRGRPTQTREIGPSTADAAPASVEAKRPAPTPPIPAARPAPPPPPSLIERVARHLKVTLHEIRYFEDGGEDIDVKTRDGVCHRVCRRDLAG